MAAVDEAEGGGYIPPRGTKAIVRGLSDAYMADLAMYTAPTASGSNPIARILVMDIRGLLAEAAEPVTDKGLSPGADALG